MLQGTGMDQEQIRIIRAVRRFQNRDTDAYNEIYMHTVRRLSVYARALAGSLTGEFSGASEPGEKGNRVRRQEEEAAQKRAQKDAEDLLTDTLKDITDNLGNLRSPDAYDTWSLGVLRRHARQRQLQFIRAQGQSSITAGEKSVTTDTISATFAMGLDEAINGAFLENRSTNVNAISSLPRRETVFDDTGWAYDGNVGAGIWSINQAVLGALEKMEIPSVIATVAAYGEGLSVEQIAAALDQTIGDTKRMMVADRRQISGALEGFGKMGLEGAGTPAQFTGAAIRSLSQDGKTLLPEGGEQRIYKQVVRAAGLRGLVNPYTGKKGLFGRRKKEPAEMHLETNLFFAGDVAAEKPPTEPQVVADASDEESRAPENETQEDHTTGQEARAAAEVERPGTSSEETGETSSDAAEKTDQAASEAVQTSECSDAPSDDKIGADPGDKTETPAAHVENTSAPAEAGPATEDMISTPADRISEHGITESTPETGLPSTAIRGEESTGGIRHDGECKENIAGEISVKNSGRGSGMTTGKKLAVLIVILLIAAVAAAAYYYFYRYIPAEDRAQQRAVQQTASAVMQDAVTKVGSQFDAGEDFLGKTANAQIVLAWKNALKGGIKDQDAQYYLADINGDGVPEMLSSSESSAIFYTVYKAKLYSLKQSPGIIGYIQGANTICFSYQDGDKAGDNIYKIVNGQFQRTAYGQYELRFWSSFLEDTGWYSWNGQEVDATEYAKSKKAAFNENSAVYLYGGKSTSYDYNSIGSAIDKY